MSKGLGKKIAIRFTEDLLEAEGEPSISNLGQSDIVANRSGNGASSIVFIKFTSLISGEMKSIRVYTTVGGNSIKAAIYTDSSDSPHTLLGTTETKATGVNAWIDMSLDENVDIVEGVVYWLAWMPSSDIVGQFAWETGGANQRKTQDSTWEIFPTTASATRYTANQVWSIYGVVWGGEPTFNAEAFSVTGQERKYIGGELIDGDYQIGIVERHPTSNSENTILLTMKPTKRFNNVEGQLTVEYDNLKGDLQGEAGSVENFSIEFLPTDLIPKPNPIVTERFTVSSTINIDFTETVYSDRYENEKFITIPNCVIKLTPVGEINP